MDGHRGRYRAPLQEFDMRIGTSSAVLSQTFVAESLLQDERRDDGLGAFRGAVTAVLLSLVVWVALGFLVFRIF